MTKTQLLTSALTLLASTAQAEVTFSGSARIGLTYTDDGTDSTTAFSSRVRIGFTGSGETDGGLSFGASVRNDQSGVGNTENGDSTVFIGGGFGRLTMGDVNGAADALVGQVSGVGYGPNDALQEVAFLGTHKTAAYYENSSGAFSYGLGAGQLLSGDRTYNIGAKYTADTYSVALGWETDTFTDVDLISLGASATLGLAVVKSRISDSNVPGEDAAWALSVDYTAGATTVTAFYTDFGNSLFDADGIDDDFLSQNTQHIGLGAAYDLGGGARVAGGIVKQLNDTAVADQTFADVGLKFSF